MWVDEWGCIYVVIFLFSYMHTWYIVLSVLTHCSIHTYIHPSMSIDTDIVCMYIYLPTYIHTYYMCNIDVCTGIVCMFMYKYTLYVQYLLHVFNGFAKSFVTSRWMLTSKHSSALITSIYQMIFQWPGTLHIKLFGFIISLPI